MHKIGIYITASGQNLTSDKDVKLAADAQDTIKIRLTASEEWDGMRMYARFFHSSATNPIDVRFDGVDATIPHEFLEEGVLSVAVYGELGEKRMTTNRVRFEIVQSIDWDGLQPVEATPATESLLARMETAADAAEQAAANILQRAQNGEFDGEPGPQGPQGIQGEPGSDATATDVRINGESITVDGVAEIDSYGLVKSAMCDGKGPAWTDAEKLAARERMGIGDWELINEITVEEDCTYVHFDKDINGNEFELDEAFFIADVYKTPENTGHKLNFVKESKSPWGNVPLVNFAPLSSDAAVTHAIRALYVKRLIDAIIPVQTYCPLNEKSTPTLSVLGGSSHTYYMIAPCFGNGGPHPPMSGLNFGSYKNAVGAGTVIRLYGRRII